MLSVAVLVGFVVIVAVFIVAVMIMVVVIDQSPIHFLVQIVELMVNLLLHLVAQRNVS